MKDGNACDSKSPPTIVLGGFSRLPTNAVNVYGLGGTLSVEIEIDPYDMRVVDASCNCVSQLGQKLLVQSLLGENVDVCISHAIATIRDRYFSTAQRAMIAALEDIAQQIKRMQNDNSIKESQK